MNNKIGLFGGTFDPVHFGHIKTVTELIKIRKLDQLIIIPCNISPHKKEKQTASGHHRIKMLELAFGQNKNIMISDYEIKKGKVSYTFETIKHFKEQFKHIELIIGFDNLLKFESWFKPEEILEMVQLVVMRRKNEENYIPNRFFKFVEFVETPLVNISSTEIRSNIKSGKNIEEYLPENIIKYIDEHKLYRE